MAEILKRFSFLDRRIREDIDNAPHGQLMAEKQTVGDMIVIGGIMTLAGSLGVVTSILVRKLIERTFGKNILTSVASRGVAVAGSMPSLLIGICGLIVLGPAVEASRLISRRLVSRKGEM